MKALNKIGEKIAKLIDVKSIVTITLTILIYKLSLEQIVSGEQIVTIYTLIIGFYFGTQSQKKNSETKEPSSEET